MKDKLHVLVVPTWYPNGKDKLLGIYHKTFCEALAAHDEISCTNMIYIYRQGLSLAYKYPFMQKYSQDEYDGYTVYIKKILNMIKFGFDIQAYTYTRNLEKLFKKYVKEHGMPDIIHAHVSFPAGYASAKIGKKYNIPVVMTDHALAHYKRPQEKKFNEFTVKNVRMTCVSKFMQDTLEKEHGISAELLPNVVDTTVFGKEEHTTEKDLFRLVSVSALRDGKRVENTIKALKMLRDSGEIGDFRFTVVGSGDMEAFYKQTTQELSMGDVTEFVGQKTPEQVAKILSHTDTLVLSSDSETFGIPAIEALAAGVPVVSTRCYGPEEFLDENNSELCEIGSVEDLARAIKRMYERKGTFDTEYLKSTAGRYSSKSVADRAVSIYRECIENKEKA